MDAAYKEGDERRPEQRHSEERSAESEFMGAALTEIPELVRMANPCIYVNKEMPPFLIVHGTMDAVVPVEQSVAFAETIEKTAGKEKVKLYLAQGVPHHGRVWWHEEWVADLCFDYLDQIFGRKNMPDAI